MSVSMDLVGRSLGRWTLEARLGEGAMGPVYRAVSTGKTHGALHVVRPDLTDTPEKKERLRREAKTFQKVEHPNVPRLLDADEAEGMLFLVYELISGRSLQYRLDRREPLPPGEARDLATDLLSALAALHDKGVVHGDVKPASILSGPEGYWKLTGFSLAPYEAEPSGFRGTPLFMAPERCEGLPPSIGTDLYSAGATVYAALAGEPPFLRPSVAAILAAHINDTPPDLSARVPGVEKDLLNLVGLLMAKSPAKRPPDARIALAVLTRKERPRSKTQAALAVPLVPEAAETVAGDAQAPKKPDEAPPPPGTTTTRRKAHQAVEEEERHHKRDPGKIPWARAFFPLVAAGLMTAAAIYAPDPMKYSTAIRLGLGLGSIAVALLGVAALLAGMEPEGLSPHAVARTLLARIPLRLSVWWNRRRDPVRAALALGQLGDLGAGEILLDAGEPRLAADEFLRAGIPLAAAIVFERLDAPLEAIEAYLVASKPEEAERVARDSKKDEAAGELFEEAGKLEEAQRAFARAEKPLRVARLLERSGKLHEAAKHFELGSELAKAAELYERAGSTSDAARLYHRQGDLVKVATVWEKAGDQVNASRWRAEAELAEGRRANAARAFEKAGIYDRAADLFLAQNLLPDAIRCAEKHGDPAHLAPLCARAGDFARAAQLHEKAGQHREAARCYHELQDAAKEATALEKAGSSLEAAEVWLKAGADAKAEKALTSIPAASPDRKAARARLGELHARAGRVREAALALKESLDGETPNETNVSTFIECADALAACGETQEAIERLEKVAALPFAPPTLRMRIAELEKKRATSLLGPAANRTTRLGGKDLVGLELDRYKATSYSGEGELSWGYEGEHILLKRAADIRVLKSGADEEQAEQFYVESRALALAAHPTLPEIYDAGRTANGLSYVALEVPREPTLRQLLRQAQGPLPLARAATITAGVLQGLALAHEARVVHGDVKPENILVGEGDRSRIVRFAFARQVAPLTATQTLPFLALRSYAAPEQLAGSAANAASDQFAVAVLLYEMLAGFHPFAGVTDPVERASHVPRPLDAVAPSVPPALAGAVARALAIDGEDRHTSVTALLGFVSPFVVGIEVGVA